LGANFDLPGSETLVSGSVLIGSVGPDPGKQKMTSGVSGEGQTVTGTTVIICSIIIFIESLLAGV
jgi:hypothetical protein